MRDRQGGHEGFPHRMTQEDLLANGKPSSSPGEFRSRRHRQYAAGRAGPERRAARTARAASGQARVLQPRREQERQDRAGDHPRGPRLGRVAAGPDGGGADQRQHRHGVSHRLPCPGPSVRGGDLAGEFGRAGPPDDGLRRRGDRGRPGRGGGRRPGLRVRPGPGRGGCRRGRRRRGAFRVDQFHRAANVLAHERHTGPELWHQSAGRIDVFVDMPGTCGSFTGVARALKRFNPDAAAPTSSSRPAPRYSVAGP